jgi:hypothetical protein
VAQCCRVVPQAGAAASRIVPMLPALHALPLLCSYLQHSCQAWLGCSSRFSLFTCVHQHHTRCCLCIPCCMQPAPSRCCPPGRRPLLAVQGSCVGRHPGFAFIEFWTACLSTELHQPPDSSGCLASVAAHHLFTLFAACMQRVCLEAALLLPPGCQPGAVGTYTWLSPGHFMCWVCKCSSAAVVGVAATMLVLVLSRNGADHTGL